MSGNEEAAGNRPACAACKHRRKKCPATCQMAPHFPAENMHQFQEVLRVFGLANVTKIIRHLNFQEREEAVKSMKWEASLWTKNPIYGPYGEFKRLELDLNLLKQELNARSVPPQSPLMIDNAAWRRENSSYVLPVEEDGVNFVHNNNNNSGNIVLESSLNNNGSFTSRGHERGYQAVGPCFVQAQTNWRYGPLSGPPNVAPILLGIGQGQAAVGKIGYNGGVLMGGAGAGAGDHNNVYALVQKREEGKGEDLTDFYSQDKSSNY